MSEILGKLMEILYKRGYVEYHSSLYANVLKEYNLEVPGLRPAWANRPGLPQWSVRIHLITSVNGS